MMKEQNTKTRNSTGSSHTQATPKSSNLAQNEPKPGSESRGPNGQTQRVEDTKAEMSGRERLKRHRVEMAGRVWIPDVWGQEESLKDWADCTAFDAVGNSSLVLARAALVEEGRRIRTSAGGLRIEKSC